MAMPQFYIQIRSEEGNAMSTYKLATPKMINAMKALCIKYEKMFKVKYTVKRFLPSPKGMKQF
jgi:hypothetical protein